MLEVMTVVLIRKLYITLTFFRTLFMRNDVNF